MRVSMYFLHLELTFTPPPPPHYIITDKGLLGGYWQWQVHYGRCTCEENAQN